MRHYTAMEMSQMAEEVNKLQTEVRATVIRDRSWNRYLPTYFTTPTVTIWGFESRNALQPRRGATIANTVLTKSQEYRRLEAHGLPVPRWCLLTETNQPSLDNFGPYVVTKPDMGGQGADVKIKRRGRVRYKPPENRRAVNRGIRDLLVQEFIYTGRWPVCYRVFSFLGSVLYSFRVEAARSRKPLPGPEEFREGGISICSSGAGCTFSFNYERAILELGAAAHRAFPEQAALGIDIVRCAETGQLYILEVNTGGTATGLCSRMGRSIQAELGAEFASQFGATQIAAEAIVNAARQHAA